MGSILSSGKRKTRKKQRCFGCERTFDSGTELNFCNYADNGTVTTSYICDVCQEIIDSSEFWKHNDLIEFGEIKNGDPDMWEEFRKQTESEG